MKSKLIRRLRSEVRDKGFAEKQLGQKIDSYDRKYRKNRVK